MILMKGASILFLFCFLFFHKVHAAELDIISDSKFLTDGDTLVSETGIFELGFFQPGSSENRYLGIWFKKVSVRTVVWVANREHPLPGVSTLLLKVVDPGILVLFNNMSMIWSSNTTMTSQNATAKLQDTGNLVLTDQQEKVLWQSFDYPTDTLLYGMKIGKDYLRGIEWYLSSWKDNQDPAQGEFTWSAETHGYLVMFPGVLLISIISTWLWYAQIKRNNARSENGNLQGVLEGLQIAVKRLSGTSDQGVDEFKNEVICISRLQHRNLVKFLGFAAPSSSTYVAATNGRRHPPHRRKWLNSGVLARS